MDSADKLKKDVLEIALPEGRMPGSQGHDAAMEFLSGRMTEIGLTTYSGDSFKLKYSLDSVPEVSFCNLVGAVKSANPEKPPLLIGAHYDSVLKGHCADDNAAAVAITLAAAEHFSLNAEKLERDVVIALFDAEEPPYFCGPAMGSNYFCRYQMDGRKVHTALIMDLVGHDICLPESLLQSVDSFPFASGLVKNILSDIKKVVFITGAESALEMKDVFEQVEVPKNITRVNALNRYSGDLSDHGAFRAMGLPYLFFTCGRWEHYHSETDTPEKLNYEKMAGICRYLISLSESLIRTDLTAGDYDDETVRLEADSLQSVCGKIVTKQLLKFAGIKKIETREDIDTVAKGLLGLGI
jgi:hypothetical protein